MHPASMEDFADQLYFALIIYFVAHFPRYRSRYPLNQEHEHALWMTLDMIVV